MVKCVVNENLNKSFSENKINDWNETIFTAEIVKNYFINGGDLEDKDKFAEVILKAINIKHKTNYQTIDKWCNVRAKIWVNRAQKKDEFIYPFEDYEYYIYNAFIIKTLNGQKLEEEAMKYFSKYDICKHSTYNEDAYNCIDFWFGNTPIQVKPKSFYYSIKTTSKYSFEKILKAELKYKQGLYLTFK